jgi:stringent starvation protein B
MSPPSQPLPPKKEVALALLERSSVHLHLDPRVQGVVVPPWFKKEPQLVLQIGLNMPVPIPDLRLDEEGMSCTLSFNRSQFFCVVPWRSVFAIVGDDARGMVWPDDVPPEIARPQGEPRRDPARRSALAEVRPDDPPSKGKRPRGAPKAPGKRPQLAAAPPPIDDGDRVTPSRTAGTGRGEPSQRDHLASVPEPAAPRTPLRSVPRKPKRELPPYLRVVK